VGTRQGEARSHNAHPRRPEKYIYRLRAYPRELPSTRAHCVFGRKEAQPTELTKSRAIEFNLIQLIH
jgi:hypothetical protein